MNTLNWYINLYYKFRQYPIPEINAAYKSNELRSLYSSMLKKQFTLFQLDNRRDGEIEGIISKNNYDHMLNKKAESNLEQEESTVPMHQPEENSQPQSKLLISRPSLSSIDHSRIQRNSVASMASHESRWLVQAGPNQKNMDVFYELMIKMIRISFRRLTVETFAFDRYGKTFNKEGMHEAIKNNAEYTELYNKIYAQNKEIKENQGEQSYAIEDLSFPSSIEELKYEFLKYCITCKVYNTPLPKQQLNSSLASYNSSSSISKSSIQSQPQHQPQPTPKVEIIGDNQIQTLILKVSEGETCIFNHLIDLYLEEIRKNGNNQIQILGVKNIAQSVFEMASGKPLFNTATNSLGINRNRFRRGIFDERGQYANESDALSNSNLLLATWFDLILFKEKAATLHEIIEKLVSLGDHNSYLSSIGPTDRLGSSEKFYLKISSYLHLLILNTTKNIFAQSLCKINYLLIVTNDILGDSPQQLKRSFKDIKLRRFEYKDNEEIKSFENVQVTYDKNSKKYLWKEESIELLLSKWKIIANAITEVCVKNSKAFFASIFQKCAQLLDQQLSLQVELVNQLMDISQNITLEGEIKQRQGQKCDFIKRGLNLIIRQIIGFSSERFEEGEEEKYLGINSFANFRGDRYKQSSFVNREESTQELSKWTEIIGQNIFLFTQYRENLKEITTLFKNNHIYIALWFNKFHTETKILLKKMNKAKLQRIFAKFLKEIPILWDSMHSQKEQKRNRNRLKRIEKSKFRNRISSIKTEGPLSLIQKKAIVLNYMLKAELQLYSHYMQINLLNGQKNFSDLFDKQVGTKKQQSSRPDLFSHALIKGLLLFSIEEEVEPEMSEVDSIRREIRHFTSNFTLVPKSFIEIENTRTMNNIERSQVNVELQELMKVMAHFEKPMNIELNLKEHWKQKFGDIQVTFLGQISDYLRYINEINYLYQFWTWAQESKKDQPRKIRIQLLDGCQFQNDLNTLDAYFKELKGNQQFMNELELMKGSTQKLIIEEQLSEILKRIKIHNKELYMINETIIEAENYFKLLGSNLIGRDKDEAFKKLLQEAIITYKTNKREKLSVRMLDKAQQSLQLESISMKIDSKKTQIRFDESQNYQIKHNTNTCKETSSIGRLIKRAGSFVSHFQFTPEYYKIQSKIVRVNCLIASFDVDNSIYKNIKSYRVLSKERLERLAIIGNKYYDKLEYLINCDKGNEQNELLISEQLLVRIKNVYQKKLLVFMTTLINLNYDMQGKMKKYSKDRGSTRRQFTNIPEQHIKNYNSVLKKYSEILKKFIYCKIRENIKRMEERERFQEANNNENDRKEHRQFSICRFIEEILQLSEKKQEYGEQSLLINLEGAIEKETNIKFCQQFKRQLERQSDSLQVYKTEEQKVQYLRKKLSYLLMRQMYFSLNYDNDFLEQKSVNSKRNYTIYEERIASFYEEIIQLDYEQYMDRKQEQLKKRSVHLKNYQFKYERQPTISPLEKNINQLICCLFNQLLNTYTSTAQYKMFTRRHKPIPHNEGPHQLFNQYCASEYTKKINKEDTQKPAKKKLQKKRKKQTDSISSIFAQMFQMKMNNVAPSIEEFPQQVQKQGSEYHTITILVYTEQKFQLSQSIKVYLKILTDYQYNSGNAKSKHKFLASEHALVQEPITEMELQIIKINERSLITMLKSDFLEKINSAKCTLIRKNLIANIQKLYINLDVRHKVFESFKDRILNYEMQKTKIYHQYMDYIRGLKLDVYSHMAGEQSLPYIKIIHAVKLYRLQIKKMELEQRVNQEFQKNLQKWNIGIQKNMSSYDLWLEGEEKYWKSEQDQYLAEKKNLFQIFHAVSKQMARQNKMQKRKKSGIEQAPHEQSNVESIVEQFKTASSKNLKTLSKKNILKQKQFFEEKKMLQRHHEHANSAVLLLNKYAFSQSTKPQTKCEKSSILNNRSQGGLRGLSIKYDPSNYLNQKQHEKEKNIQQNGRKTQTCNSNMKVSQVFKKKEKRYLSAQKYRSTNQHY